MTDYLLYSTPSDNPVITFHLHRVDLDDGGHTFENFDEGILEVIQPDDRVFGFPRWEVFSFPVYDLDTLLMSVGFIPPDDYPAEGRLEHLQNTYYQYRGTRMASSDSCVRANIAPLFDGVFGTSDFTPEGFVETMPGVIIREYLSDDTFVQTLVRMLRFSGNGFLAHPSGLMAVLLDLWNPYDQLITFTHEEVLGLNETFGLVVSGQSESAIFASENLRVLFAKVNPDKLV